MELTLGMHYLTDLIKKQLQISTLWCIEKVFLSGKYISLFFTFYIKISQ
jgi:hypothetical protein